ncbi:MAG: hypothetical protein M3Z10_03570, partial [Gemmatimonadota bacterium]|nr:hypothetical protein [Gemmatimonadota bacterium]
MNIHILRSVVSIMSRLHTLFLRLSLLTLVSASAAAAQSSTSARDTLSTVAKEDSTQQAGRGWLVSLLRKIARRSDDSLTTTVDSTDAETSVAEVAAPAHATSRVFRSRKDSLEYSAAHAAAERADGYRIVVDIFAHQLHVISKDDTLLTAPAATAMNS